MKPTEEDISRTFFKEANQLIDWVEKALTDWDWSLKGEAATQRLLDLFRYTHTLKGISASMEYPELSELASASCEIFRASKYGHLEIRKDMIPLLLDVDRACRKLLNKEKLTEQATLLKRLKACLGVR